MSVNPTVESVLGWLRHGALRPGENMLPPEDQEVRAKARQVRACFQQFPEVLQTILDATVARPAVDYRLPRNGEFENYALLREGQNQVAAMLAYYVDLADQIDRSEHELSTAIDERRDAQDLGSGGGWDGLAVR